jgi:hypothetical protein
MLTKDARTTYHDTAACDGSAGCAAGDFAHLVSRGQVDRRAKLARVPDGGGVLQFELGNHANGFPKFDSAIRPNGLPKLTYSLSFSL